MTTDRAAGTLTVAQVLDDLAREFIAHGVAEPASEAREIVAALFDVPRFWPVTNGGAEVDASTVERAKLAAKKRVMGAPLAYAVGRAPFRHLTLDVDEREAIQSVELRAYPDLRNLDLVQVLTGGNRGGNRE